MGEVVKIKMKELLLSVIIPTYNRKNILRKCLNALFVQEISYSECEIIVVNDGSTDETEELVKSLQENSPCVLRYFMQENKGPAAARNTGIKNAAGKIILFLGDDIIAIPGLLKEHKAWHALYSNDNISVLGGVTWSPEIKTTPFMRWLENGGPQFSFWELKHQEEANPEKYFYTANISLKKSFLLQNGVFDESFSYAAYEDTELAFRLKKKGLVLKYNERALGYHNHYTSLEDGCRRMIKVGESFPLLAARTGHEYSLKKSFFKKIIGRVKFEVYYVLAKFCEHRMIKKNIFGYVMDYCKFIGFERANKKQSKTTR